VSARASQYRQEEQRLFCKLPETALPLSLNNRGAGAGSVVAGRRTCPCRAARTGRPA